jgi:hypothetical protein
MQVTGVLTQIHASPYGNKMMYRVEVNGQQYGMGETNPTQFGVVEGGMVTFDAVQKGKFVNVTIGTLAPAGVGAEPTQAPVQQAAPQASGGGLTRDQYWSNKEARDLVVQISIQFQASRNSAIAAAEAMLQSGAFTFPASAKAAAKYDMMLALIDQLSDRFYLQTLAVAEAGGVTTEEAVVGQVEGQQFQ